MPGSGNERAYALGVTAIVVGLSAVVKVPAEQGQLSGLFNIQAGGGTLFIAHGPSAAVATGVHVVADKLYELEGPAVFYLSAAGATMTVGLVKRYSQGHTFV